VSPVLRRRQSASMIATSPCTHEGLSSTWFWCKIRSCNAIVVEVSGTYRKHADLEIQADGVRGPRLLQWSLTTGPAYLQDDVQRRTLPQVDVHALFQLQDVYAGGKGREGLARRTPLPSVVPQES
jgi:hypothetical protein